jgi:hypothetical protein
MALIANEIATNNVLFSHESFEVTVVIDFDWAQIGLAVDETLRPINGRYARLPALHETDPDRVRLRHAMLLGFPSTVPPNSRSVDWKLASMWNDEFSKIGAIQPGVAEGIEGLAFVYSARDLIYPNTLSNQVIVNQRSRESLERERSETELLLDRHLRDHGI